MLSLGFLWRDLGRLGTFLIVQLVSKACAVQRAFNNQVSMDAATPYHYRFHEAPWKMLSNLPLGGVVVLPNQMNTSRMHTTLKNIYMVYI